MRSSVKTGLNQFRTDGIATSENDVLGLYISSARVSLDYTSNDPSGPVYYELNAKLPDVGDELRELDGRSIRTYSLNATVVDECLLRYPKIA